MNRKLVVVMLLALPFIGGGLQGCAVKQAMEQPDKKDVSVFAVGTPRYRIIAEVGKPVETKVAEDGTKIDVFSFVQGYSKGAKAARAFGHGVMDVATLGLWEVIGSPTEAIASGDKVIVRVYYDKNDLVERVVPIKGGKELEN